MKILFISRSYPPSVGGLEAQNYTVCQGLSKITKVGTILNPYGKNTLPVFLPWCAVKSVVLLKSYDVVLLGDGVLGISGWFIKKLCPGKPVVCILHGLDVTFPTTIYQRLWLGIFLPSLDKLIAVSNATLQAALNKRIPAGKLTYIANGVNIPHEHHTKDVNSIEKLVGFSLTDRKILLTLGRLVERKGIAWFVNTVLPKLDETFLYLIAGDGPETPKIAQAICKRKLAKKVILLGNVNETDKEILLRNSHLFVQPNIEVYGDMEGFGISVLEANSYGLPVIAANTEGLKDAIHDGENGWLVPTKDARRFKLKIEQLFADMPQLDSFGSDARLYCKKNFDAGSMVEKYYSALDDAFSQR